MNHLKRTNIGKTFLVLNIVLVMFIIGCSKSEVSIIKESGPSIDTYFCPMDDCESVLINEISSAKSSIYCAFYDIDLSGLIAKLEEKSKQIDVKLVIDSDNYFSQTKSIPVVLDDKEQLSHNKFCVIDGKTVTTGSMNPTENGNLKNNNNLIIIGSRTLAANYHDEFEELWNKEFGEGEKVENPKIVYNGKNIENYFCPEDDCSEHLVYEILSAKHSICFMIFSLTDENVADAILFSNVSEIHGVMDNMQAGGQYSQFDRLKGFEIDVKKDNNTNGFLHHKVVIIDNSTVITGSYNPTSAGDNKNDENMLIIHDKRVAEKFLDEFEHIYLESS